MSQLSYDNVGTLLDRTTRLLKAHFQRAFKDAEVDLTPEQWVVLDHLHKEGSSSQTELANGTFKDAPTVSRIIDKLAKKGLAARKRFPNDRRRYQVALTAKGESIHEQLLPRVDALRVQAWGGLSESDYSDLTRVLDRIRDNFPQ
ncbi:MAG: DNA-binding MarR family transcriptional regulator [Neolewinella sp.]